MSIESMRLTCAACGAVAGHEDDCHEPCKSALADAHRLLNDMKWREFDACLTGDCPHHHANDCLKAFAERAEKDRQAIDAHLSPTEPPMPTEPTRAELTEAAARWAGWRPFNPDDGIDPRLWQRPGEYPGVATSSQPDFLADTPESRDVAFRLLVALVRRGYDVMFTARSGGFGVAPGSGLRTERCLNPYEAIARAAHAAGIIGGEQNG